VKAVQRRLGRASAAMTLDVYADLFEDDLDAVADALNSQAITQSVGKLWQWAATDPNRHPPGMRKPPANRGFSWWLRPASIR